MPLSTPAAILLCLFGAIALLHLCSCRLDEHTRWRTVRKATKPLLMLSLLIFYLLAAPAVSLATALAIGFGLLGDIALQIPQKPQQQWGFLCGLAFFLIGHICYIISFIRKIPAWPPLWMLLLPGMILFLIGAAAFLSLWKGLGAMRVPAAVYMLVILTMAYFTLIHGYTVHSLAGYGAMLGGILFVTSDYLLARDGFCRRIPHASFWIMLTYIAAQCLLVLGLIG